MHLSAETSISLMLLGVSIIYFLFQPKNINYFYGYRTPRSMKSKEHWKVANKMAVKMLMVLSLFNVALGYVVVDILNYNFPYIFLTIIVLEFAIMFYLIEKKLGEIDSTKSEMNRED